MPFVEAHFHDEAREIGSGRRLVHARWGRRWVVFRCPYSFRAVRMRVGDGRRVVVDTAPVVRIRALRRRIRDTYGRSPPAAVREMLEELRNSTV